MPFVAELRTYLTITQIVLFVLLLSKLQLSNLLLKYRYFSLLIGFEAVRLLFMSALPQRSDVYALAYFATAPISWVLFVLVVLEFFQLTLANHQGIATLGRKVLTWSLVLSAALSALTLLFDLQHTKADSAILFNFILLERLVMTSLLVLMLSLVVFLSLFPVPLSRNIRVHACIFAGYFAVRTLLLFGRLLFGPDIIVGVNLMFQSLGAACLMAWTLLLTGNGEAVPVRAAPTGSEARLLAQLEAINDTLMRSSRK